MAVERDQAERARSRPPERARLARAVHDGVLQVLALVQRRGARARRRGAELGRLAGEQESALRALIRQQDALAGSVERRAGRPRAGAGAGSSRTAAGAPWPPRRTRCCCPAHVVAELVAVVGACLDNVARHVGPDAPAWVLLEDLAGPGRGVGPRRGAGHPGRPARARPRPRAGSASPQSIRGRVARPRRHRRARAPARSAPSGRSPCPAVRVAPVTIHSEHPFLEPEADRDPVRRLRGRLGGAVTLWTTGDEGDRGRADRVLADGRRRRAGAGARPRRPRLRPRTTGSRRPAGPSCSCWLGAPRPRRRVRRYGARPRRAVPDGGVRADRVGAACWSARRPGPAVSLESVAEVGWSALVTVHDRRGRRSATTYRRWCTGAAAICARLAAELALGSARDDRDSRSG